MASIARALASARCSAGGLGTCTCLPDRNTDERRLMSPCPAFIVSRAPWLRYMQVVADSWRGAEATGMERQVRMLVKCPPKAMLPDTTRVHIRHRLQRHGVNGSLVLERELCTLDVPYGETFSVQERWVVTPLAGVSAASGAPHCSDSSSMGGGTTELAVFAHVHFKSRGMLSEKIKQHALKKSRKCAALAAELLGHASVPDDLPTGSARCSMARGGLDDELAQLREQYEVLLDAGNFRAQELDLTATHTRSTLAQN